MADAKKTGNIRTPEFRASYAWIAKPQKAMEPGEADKYSVSMLFPKGADLSALKAAATQVLIDTLGADKSKWPKNMYWPIRDQAEKEGPEYVPGAFFINTSTTRKPGVVNARNEVVDNSTVYSGCWCRATVRPFWFTKKGNKGVSFGLQNIQFLRDGDSLAGPSNPENDFEAVEGDSPFGGDDMPASQDPGASESKSPWE